MSMTLEELLKRVPEGWAVCLDCQPKYNKSFIINGKKRKPAMWSVYISNGALIGTSEFMSTWTDGNDLNETFEKALSSISKAICLRHDERLNKKTK